MTTIVNVNQPRRQTGCLVQLLWFLFVGWWASLAAAVFAYLCMVTVLGIPLGIIIINKMPKIIALREPGGAQSAVTVVATGQMTVVNVGTAQQQQRTWLLRLPYFVFIGCWLGALWMVLAWVICCTVVGLPVGLWMFDQAPAVLSLHRD